MAMFEKHEREARTLAEMRQEFSKELARLKQTLSGIEQRLGEVTEQQSKTEVRLVGQVKTLTDAGSELVDRIKPLDRFITCPRCGVVLELDKVPTSGGLLRQSGKRCPLCSSHGLFDDVPLLTAKKSGECRK